MKDNAQLLVGLLAFGLSAGLTTAQEPGAGRRGGPPGAVPRPTSPLIAVLDANQNGILDPDEIAGASAALKKLDKDSDGKLSGDEFRPPGFGGPGPGAPGGARPGAGSGRLAPGARTSFAATTLAKNDTEKKILEVLKDIDATQRRGSLSVPEQDGRILRLLTESLAARNVVELGTSIGYSSIWFCLGLQQTGGKLMTFEIDAGRVAQARANFKRAGVESIVTLIEGDAHQELAKVEGPVDLVFLDADKEGYLDYLEKLLPKLRPGGLVIAHNMNERQADPRYVKAITTNPDLETVFLNLETSGIGVTLKKR